MRRRLLPSTPGIVLLIGAVTIACAPPLPTTPGAAPPEPTPTTTEMRPATVHDLVWTASDYDVAHVQKERFLEPLRLCWSKATEASPTAAGVAHVDLTIDSGGTVRGTAVRALLFHDRFLGDTASEAETTFAGCANAQFNKLPVAPATAETGTLSIDLRLLPARPAHVVATPAP